MILRDSIDIHASPQAIFAFFDDIERHYLHWHPDHKLFRWKKGRGLALGNEFHFEEVIAGKLLKKTVAFTRVDPGQCIEFAPTFWLMRLLLPRMLFRLEPLPGGVQRVIAEIHLRIGPLGARLNQREFDAVREHMRVEGENLKHIVEMGSVPAAAAPPTDDARVERLVDARCLEHLLGWLRRIFAVVPVDAMWAVLAWHAGLAWPWVALWFAARLTLFAWARRLGDTLAPLVPTDPARGLARGDLLFFASSLLRAALVPVFFVGTSENLMLIFTLLGNASAGMVVVSASGRPRAYWLANALPLGLVIAGWALHGGGLGWSIVALLLLALPLSILAVRNQRRSWEQLVRANLANEALAASLAVERDRAQAAGDARTRFFAAASHDLRQPLHALSINATTLALLAERGGDAQLRDLSTSIGRSLSQSQGLLDALLDISRLDAGAVKLHLADHDVGALLEQLHDEFSALAAQRALSFTLQLGHPAPWSRTDADQLQRILRNLLDNAFKFTPQGSVRLALAATPGPAWRITVADTGCGIPQAQRERVFEEFVQLGNPARDRSRGLGLGLAIVRRTAAMLGAQVRCAAPADGCGAVFELLLPALATAGTPAEAHSPPAPTSPEALTVLLVDDEDDILQALAGLLRAVGWRAHTASSADAALAIAADADCRIDAALVDHRLPQGDGVALIRELRALRPGVPALVVTGDVAVQWEVQRHGLKVLHKPLDGHSLAAAIGEEVAAAARWKHRLDTFADPGATTMNLIDALHGRRSVRSYQPTPLPRDLVEDLIWHAAQVPLPPVSDETSWRFIVADGRERIARWGEEAKAYAAAHQPIGEPWSWPARSDFEVFWGAPLLVLICARSGHPEAPFDCCRAGQNLALAAHARGLGSCWVGAPMPWLNAGPGREALALPAGYDAAVAMVLGYAADTQQEGRSRPRPPLAWVGESSPR